MDDVDAVASHPTEVVDLDSLTPHPRNYQAHPADQLSHIAQSLRDHGQYRNVVVARDGTILAGHGVVEAAREIGMTQVAVIRLDLDPNDQYALKILTGDNEIGNLAAVDDRRLTDLLRELAEEDALLGTGFDALMLANLALITRTEDELPSLDHAAEWANAGMPEFEEFATPYRIVVSFDSTDDRDRFLTLIGVEVINRKDRDTWSVRWPPRAKEDISSLRFEPGDGESAAET